MRMLTCHGVSNICVTLGSLSDAFKNAGGIILTSEQLEILRNSYGSKSDGQQLFDDLDQPKHSIYDIGLDIWETLNYSNKSQEVFDAYETIKFA